MALKRIFNERQEFESDPAPNIAIAFNDEDIFHWQGNMLGPDNSPYQDGIFSFDVKIPPGYPFKPPEIRFTTRIFHPNLDSDGYMCTDVFKKSWPAALTISTILLSISSLLIDPNTDETYASEAGLCYQSDRKKFTQIARKWTQKYAINQDIENKMIVARKVIIEQSNMMDRELLYGINAERVANNLFIWCSNITSPLDSPYEGRVFVLYINFPWEYPHKPPAIVFRTFIYHPNVSSNGYMSIDRLKKQWSPEITFSKVLLSVLDLLTKPDLDNPINQEAAHLFQHDREKYNETARKCTQKMGCMKRQRSETN